MVNGTRLAGGDCQLHRSYHLRKGERHGERIVELDPSTCRFVVAVGQWTSTPSSPGRKSKHTGASLDVGEGTGGADKVEVGGPSAAMTEMTNTAWQHLWHEDPVNLDVTSDFLTATGTTAAGSLTYVQYWHDMEWLGESGWELNNDGDYWDPSPDSYEGGAHAWSAFTNGEFCWWEGPTYVNYDQRIKVYYDDSVDFDYTHTGGGGCYSWLSFNIDGHA